MQRSFLCPEHQLTREVERAKVFAFHSPEKSSAIWMNVYIDKCTQQKLFEDCFCKYLLNPSTSKKTTGLWFDQVEHISLLHLPVLQDGDAAQFRRGVLGGPRGLYLSDHPIIHKKKAGLLHSLPIHTLGTCPVFFAKRV